MSIQQCKDVNIEKFIQYCESKPFVTYDTPFGPDTLTFRVYNKIFAITGLDESEFKVNLKCDPEYSLQLREEYQEITPGYHMNKKHWNTVKFDGTIPLTSLKKLIDHSYELVLSSISNKQRAKKH